MNIISEMSSVIIVNPSTSQLCDTLSYQVVSGTCSISNSFIIHRTGKIAYLIDTHVHNIHIRYVHTEQDRNSCITYTIRIIRTQQRMHGMVILYQLQIIISYIITYPSITECRQASSYKTKIPPLYNSILQMKLIYCLILPTY